MVTLPSFKLDLQEGKSYKTFKKKKILLVTVLYVYTATIQYAVYTVYIILIYLNNN